MAFLSIDKNRLELTVKVGILEKYKPDSEIVEIFEEVESLRKRLMKNRKRIVGNIKDNREALDVLQKDEEKAEKWGKYINKTYAKQLSVIQKKIDNKNEKICANFSEFVKQIK